MGADKNDNTLEKQQKTQRKFSTGDENIKSSDNASKDPLKNTDGDDKVVGKDNGTDTTAQTSKVSYSRRQI